MKVASIGECMIEFSAAGDGLFARGFGGDTLNTALYLSRLGIDTSYVTALGDDALSEAMLAAWRAEGIATDEVLRAERPRARPLHDRARRARRTQLSLLARPRAGPRVLRPRRRRHAGAAVAFRLALFLRHQPVALWRERQGAVARTSRSRAPPRRQGRLRRQLSPARLERCGRRAARLQRHPAAGRSGAADAGRRAGAVRRCRCRSLHRPPARCRDFGNRGQARRARLLDRGERAVAWRCRRLPWFSRSTPRRPAIPSMPAIWRRGWAARRRSRPRAPAIGSPAPSSYRRAR